MADDTPEPVVQARAAAEAVRQINHPTITGRGGLRYPSEVGDAVSALARAAHGLQQALPQLARIVEEIADDPNLYDDRYGDRDPAHTAHLAIVALAAAERAGQANLLSDAANHLSHLGVRDA